MGHCSGRGNWEGPGPWALSRLGGGSHPPPPPIPHLQYPLVVSPASVSQVSLWARGAAGRGGGGVGGWGGVGGRGAGRAGQGPGAPPDRPRAPSSQGEGLSAGHPSSSPVWEADLGSLSVRDRGQPAILLPTHSSFVHRPRFCSLVHWSTVSSVNASLALTTYSPLSAPLVLMRVRLRVRGILPSRSRSPGTCHL